MFRIPYNIETSGNLLALLSNTMFFNDSIRTVFVPTNNVLVRLYENKNLGMDFGNMGGYWDISGYGVFCYEEFGGKTSIMILLDFQDKVMAWSILVRKM